MKSLLLALSLLLLQSAHAATENRVYGIHLYFNEKEFVDVLTLNADGLTGKMSVPNDFDGKIDGLKITNGQVSFDLFVPKNPGRPQDLIFHYEGKFFDSAEKQLIGFVTIKGETDFVASFTGFLR